MRSFWAIGCCLFLVCFHAMAEPMVKTGINVDLESIQLFPKNNPWNQKVDQLPVDPRSEILIRQIGAQKNIHPDFGANWRGGPHGFSYCVVDEETAKVQVEFTDYPDESDQVMYPLPTHIPLRDEDTGDRHLIILHRGEMKLYELFYTFVKGREVRAASGAVFDLKKNPSRPAGHTSADAAGLPILPGLVRYDEIARGHVDHAFRFTVTKTRKAYVPPASHYASQDTHVNLPPMGMRVRLKADYPLSKYPPQAKVILQALKTYGMLLADNGGDWFISGAADHRWNDADLNTLKRVKASDLEVVKMGKVVVGSSPKQE
ncbi:MAG: hypothetical protein SGI71_08760 [Verrucomicrobiota bacterium]|nr:hypothetical protein [Verrucomicrobiota bacterium]